MSNCCHNREVAYCPICDMARQDVPFISALSLDKPHEPWGIHVDMNTRINPTPNDNFGLFIKERFDASGNLMGVSDDRLFYPKIR